MSKATKTIETAAKAIAAKATSKSDVGFVNPFRVGSNYHAIVQSLVQLGKGKNHSFASIIAKVKSNMGKDEFKAFAAKKKQNKNGLDCEARIVQNIGVLTTALYGKALRDIGWEIRRDGKAKVAGLFRKAEKWRG